MAGSGSRAGKKKRIVRIDCRARLCACSDAEIVKELGTDYCYCSGCRLRCYKCKLCVSH